jgi:hypothetical protein
MVPGNNERVLVLARQGNQMCASGHTQSCMVGCMVGYILS